MATDTATAAAAAAGLIPSQFEEKPLNTFVNPLLTDFYQVRRGIPWQSMADCVDCIFAPCTNPLG